jgi:hypothetical protein
MPQPVMLDCAAVLRQLRKGREAVLIFLMLMFMIGWVATIAWQLWLAETKGKIWARNQYVTRESNETVFSVCVATYWVFLGFGIVMLYVMVIVALKGGVSD